MTYAETIAKLFQGDLTVNPSEPLKPEQVDGVKFLLKHDRAVLCYQTGLGKTYTALTAAKHLLNMFGTNFAVHVFCPHTAFKIFRKELKTKIHIKEFSEYSSEEVKEVLNSQVFLYSHSNLQNSREAAHQNCARFKFNLFIVDELHTIQNPDTVLYQLFREGLKEKNKETGEEIVLYPPLMKYCTMLWGLTATPLLNHIEGLFYVMDFVVPNLFGNFYSFRSRYCDTTVTKLKLHNKKKPGTFIERKIFEIKGIKDAMIEEFKSKLFNYMTIAAKDYDVRIAFKQCELDRRQISQYQLVGKGLADADRKHFATRLIDLQKVVDNSYDSTYHGELTPKEQLLVSTIQEIFMRQEAVLIYTGFYESYDRLKEVITKSGIRYSKLLEINGKVPFKDRFAVEDQIEPFSLCLLTKAGTASINLQKANNIIVYTIPFAVGDFIQLVGRITRVDSTHKVFYVTILETLGTVDSYKRAYLESNATMIKGIFGRQPALDFKDRKLSDFDQGALKKHLLWTAQGARKNMDIDTAIEFKSKRKLGKKDDE